MKKMAFLVNICLTFGFTAFAQQTSLCEEELSNGKIKITNLNANNWNEEGNSFMYGKYDSKYITVCCHIDADTKRAYPIDYKIYRSVKLGVFYFTFGNYEYHYKTEKDAALAIYTLDRCAKILEEGKLLQRRY